MAGETRQLSILHLHSTFAAGGKELRAVQLMNAFGSAARHTIVSGMPGELQARSLIDPALDAYFPHDFPPLTGRPSPARLRTLARAMRGFDLVLTYNWGAMDGVMAHRAFAGHLALPPLIHHEDGFNEDESVSLKPQRGWYRRIALSSAHAVVVPSTLLEDIALHIWKQPRARVKRIPNGIDTAAFGVAPAGPDALGLTKPDGQFWVGTMAGLRAVKQLPLLVRAFACLPENWRLVICGEGPERGAILAQAQESGIGARVHLPGRVSDPARIIGLFDIFALSSASEQFPLSVVEAMAAGLPVAAPDVGDIAQIVAKENLPFIVAGGGEMQLADALANLAANPPLRLSIGAANQVRAKERFDQSGMIDAYRALYWGAALG